MVYTHLTMEELGWIDTYLTIGLSASKISERLARSKQPIYNVIHFLENGNTIQDYYLRYKENKKNCGVKKKISGKSSCLYPRKVADNWTPEVIISRAEKKIDCSMRTLYRRFKDSDKFDVKTLPMKGKRKPNGHKKNAGNKHLNANSKTGKRTTLILQLNLDILKEILLSFSVIKVPSLL